MWDSIKSAGRTKARKKTQLLAWKTFADKCEKIIREWSARDPKGIPLTLLLIKSEYPLWTFNKYKPLIQVETEYCSNKFFNYDKNPFYIGTET